jgi:ABC-type nickel/cobalt efflux system permease component RcnA
MPDGWQNAPQEVRFVDENFGDRLGWQEVIVRSTDGVTIMDATVPSSDLTNELRSYPDGGLSNPLAVSSAVFSFAPGSGTHAAGAGTAPVAEVGDTTEGTSASGDRFTSLIAEEQISVGFVLTAMAIAFAFGMLHALGPGHGKTVVAAYLVGERGTARHALFLGATVTLTHTSSVFALGLVTLYASQFILPERLFPWLTLASAVTVVALGGYLVMSRLAGLRARAGDEVAAGHGHAHDHGHRHGHEHAAAMSWRQLVPLGVSGGLIPCPSALVVLLGAISLHRVELGLVLVLAFSLGLAAVLTGIGLGLVWASRWAPRFRRLVPSLLQRPAATVLPRALPVVSALAITAVGVFMTARVLLDPPGVWL